MFAVLFLLGCATAGFLVAKFVELLATRVARAVYGRR